MIGLGNSGMRVFAGVLLLTALLIGCATSAEPAKVLYRTKLERHKGTDEIVLVVKIENEKQADVEARDIDEFKLDIVEIKIKGRVVASTTPLPLVVGAIKSGKSESVSVKFDRAAAKKGEAGLLKLEGRAGKDITSGTYRIVIP